MPKEDPELTRTKQQIAVYQNKCNHERHRLERLQNKIVQHELKALEQTRAGGGDSRLQAEEEKRIQTEQKLYVGRLNKKLVSLNGKISQNKELRKKVDELRQERCRYDEIYTKVSHCLPRVSRMCVSLLIVSTLFSSSVTFKGNQRRWPTYWRKARRH